MPLDSTDLAWVRTYVVWTPPTDADLSARFDLLIAEVMRNPYYRGTFDPILLAKSYRIVTAEAFVRTRLYEMLDQPDAFTTEDYSESWRGNPQFLSKALDELQAMAPDGGVTIGQFQRADGYRDDPATFGRIDPYLALRNGRGF